MKINRNITALTFEDDGQRVEVRYDNRGDPFREGVKLAFIEDSSKFTYVHVLLDFQDVKLLRDKLTEFLGE